MGTTTSLGRCNTTALNDLAAAGNLTLDHCATCPPPDAPLPAVWYLVLSCAVLVGTVAAVVATALLHYRTSITRRTRRLLGIAIRQVINLWFLVPSVWAVRWLFADEVTLCGAEPVPACGALVMGHLRFRQDDLFTALDALGATFFLYATFTAAGEVARWQLLGSHTYRRMQFVVASGANTVTCATALALRLKAFVATLFTCLGALCIAPSFLLMSGVVVGTQCFRDGAYLSLDEGIRPTVSLSVLVFLPALADACISGYRYRRARTTHSTEALYPRLTAVWMTLVLLIGFANSIVFFVRQGASLRADGIARSLLLLFTPAMANALQLVLPHVADRIAISVMPSLQPPLLAPSDGDADGGRVDFRGVLPLVELEMPLVPIVEDIRAWRAARDLMLDHVKPDPASETGDGEHSMIVASASATPEAPPLQTTLTVDVFTESTRTAARRDGTLLKAVHPAVVLSPRGEAARPVAELIREMDAAGLLVLHDPGVDDVPIPWRRVDALIEACAAHAAALGPIGARAVDTNGLTYEERFAVAALTWRSPIATDGVSFRRILDRIMAKTRTPQQHDGAWVGVYADALLPFLSVVRDALLKIPRGEPATLARTRLLRAIPYALELPELAAAYDAQSQVSFAHYTDLTTDLHYAANMHQDMAPLPLASSLRTRWEDGLLQQVFGLQSVVPLGAYSADPHAPAGSHWLLLPDEPFVVTHAPSAEYMHEQGDGPLGNMTFMTTTLVDAAAAALGPEAGFISAGVPQSTFTPVLQFPPIADASMNPLGAANDNQAE